MGNLIVGQTYTLQYTGDFCHAVGFKGSRKFSPQMNEGDTVTAVFVGTIRIGPGATMERDIFYAEHDPKRNYIMFGKTEERKYITPF